MKEYKTEKFKIRLRSAPVKLKVALVALIVLSIGALMALRWVHNGIQAQTQLKREQAAAMEAPTPICRRKSITSAPCRASARLPGTSWAWLTRIPY